MPLQKVVIKPGVFPDYTPTLAEGFWETANLIRFKDGLAQKFGGWSRVSNLTFTGTVRGVHAWDDLTGNPYFAGGSEQRVEAYTQGVLLDITPIRQTDNVAVNITTNTTLGTANQVTVTDAGHGASSNDWVNILVPISAGPGSNGNLILQGLYQISNATTNTYVVTASQNATAIVTNGGAVPLFTTTHLQTYVQVTLNNHGYTLGLANAGYFSVQIATTVGGIVISTGSYTVVTTGLGGASDANNFYIVPGASASSSTTGSENGGNAQFQYLISSGNASLTYQSGYNIGAYNAGNYNTGGGLAAIALRSWYLDDFGQNLVGNYNGSTLYQWVPTTTVYAGTISVTVPMAPVSNAPTACNVSFVSNPEQMVICLGVWNASTGGMIDPNLIAWCDAGNITTWTAASNNQAGTFRIPTGSKLVGGIVTPSQVLIWTDLDAWSMQYQGLPFVWGFQKISTECGLISGHAMGVMLQQVFWMGFNNFFSLGPGGVTVLECPVWDVVFKNLNSVQKDKIHCAVNSYFQELMWFYPSATGTGEIDSYVKYNAHEKTWDYGTLARTAWADESVFGQPIAIDLSGLMQQHEIGVDADGKPMQESIQTGYFDLGDGEMYIFIERIIPDIDFYGSTTGTPSLYLTVNFLEYPNDLNNPNVGPITCGPFTITNTSQIVIIRGRSRQASLQIQGFGLGTTWRMGAIRHNGQPDGRR